MTVQHCGHELGRAGPAPQLSGPPDQAVGKITLSPAGFGARCGHGSQLWEGFQATR